MIDTWLSEIENHASSEIFKVIVANKIDLSSKRNVTESEGRELASKYGLHYFEVSAKEGSGVKEAFDFIPKSVISKMKTLNPTTAKDRPSFTLNQTKGLRSTKKKYLLYRCC